jgi:polyisoprenyl-phosphate glycosyltransferase
MDQKMACFVSVVIPLDHDADLVNPLVRELGDFLGSTYSDYEIVLIDARSADGTPAVIDQLLTDAPFVRFIQLSERYEKELVCAAGMENAIGDIVVLMDPRHDPVSAVAEGIERALQGVDVLMGVSASRAGWAYRLLRGAFRKFIAGMIHYRLPQDATLFRVVSRRALNGVLQRKRYLHHFFLDMARTGFPTDTLAYGQIDRKGRVSRKEVVSGVRKALSVLVFNSTRLLRMVSLIGLLGSALGLLISAYSLAIHLIKRNVVEGWTTLTLFMSAQFILVFLILFFFGEYLARLVDEQWEGREYGVRAERHSSVMGDLNRLNITADTTRDDLGRIQTGRDR